MIARIEDIALVAAPGVVGADQLVDGVPSLFIILQWLGCIGRVGHHLPPEETVEVGIVQIWACYAGNHSIDDVKIGKAVMVEIPGVARPRPSAHSNAARRGGILERSVAAISE